MKVVKTIIVKNWKNFVLVLVILIGAITDMKIMVKMDGDTFCEFIRFCYIGKPMDHVDLSRHYECAEYDYM